MPPLKVLFEFIIKPTWVLNQLWAIKCQNMQTYNTAVLMTLDISLRVQYRSPVPGEAL